MILVTNVLVKQGKTAVIVGSPSNQTSNVLLSICFLYGILLRLGPINNIMINIKNTVILSHPDAWSLECPAGSDKVSSIQATNKKL